MRLSRELLLNAVPAFFFTAIVGVLLLLFVVQPLGRYALELDSRPYHRFNRFIGFLIGLFKLIGWAYQSLQSESGFLAKAVAFTFSAGFCEEFVKLLPVYICLSGWDNDKKMNTDKLGFVSSLETITAPPNIIFAVGFFSGLGFGVSEALFFYSPWTNSPQLGANFVRWYALVPMHGIWAIIDTAILLWAWPMIRDSKSVTSTITGLLGVVLAAASLHGVYNASTALGILPPLILTASAIVIALFLVNRMNGLQKSIDYVKSGDGIDWFCKLDQKQIRIFSATSAIAILGMLIAYASSHEKKSSTGYYPKYNQQRPSASICPGCGGKGQIWGPNLPGRQPRVVLVICRTCGGSGYIQR